MNPSQGLVEGPIPSSRSEAEVAQKVEQGFRKAKVGSPILPFGSKNMKKMPEFFKKGPRSRLNRKEDEEITKKTILLGGITVALFILLLLFGLPLLVKLSVLLGNNKKDSGEVMEKLLPPLPPRLTSTFEATNSAKLTVSGLAEPNVEIELFKNDISVGKNNSDEKGLFTFPDIELEKGGNTFTAIAAKEKEGKSELSKELMVIYEDTPPSLELTNPSEEKLTVDNPDFDIIGKSDPEVSVTVNGKIALVDSEGNFKLKIQLNTGKNDIEVIAKSQAGNEVRKRVEIIFDI